MLSPIANKTDQGVKDMLETEKASRGNPTLWHLIIHIEMLHLSPGLDVWGLR